MTKEEMSRTIDAIYLALGSDKRVGVFDDGRLWEVKEVSRVRGVDYRIDDYRISCAYFGAVRSCLLSELESRDIFVSI